MSEKSLLASDLCSDFAASASACKSFQELLEHKDRAVLHILVAGCGLVGVGVERSRGTTYGCFADGYDRFLLLALDLPTDWRPNDIGGVDGLGGMCLEKYDKGIPEPRRYSYLKWSASRKREESAALDGYGNTTEGLNTDTPPVSGEVSPDDISLSYASRNKDGTRSNYKLAIRRSTNRFVETVQADGRIYTQSGHCAVFERKAQ